MQTNFVSERDSSLCKRSFVRARYVDYSPGRRQTWVSKGLMSNSKWEPIAKETGPDSLPLKKQSFFPASCPRRPVLFFCFSTSFPMVLTHKCQPLERLPISQPLEISLWALSSHLHPLSAGHPSRHDPLFQRRPLRCSFLAGTFHRQKWFASEDRCARRTIRGLWFSSKGFHKALPIPLLPLANSLSLALPACHLLCQPNPLSFFSASSWTQA